MSVLQTVRKDDFVERYNRILFHEKYKEYIDKNNQAEANRRFCRHNMGHFLDVARIAVILYKTENYDITKDSEVAKDLIYAAALLHDVGRWMQYEEGIPHEKAGVMLAGEILLECGYDQEECRVILEAIGNHRNAEIKDIKNLSGLLYQADKLSRACFACEAESQCDWKKDKKNLKVLW